MLSCHVMLSNHNNFKISLRWPHLPDLIPKSHAVGTDSNSFRHFQENILQPTNFKISPLSTSDLLLEFFPLIINMGHLWK